MRQTLTSIRSGLGKGATVKRLQELMESPKHRAKYREEEKEASKKCYERSASFNPGRSKEELMRGALISNHAREENSRRKKSIDINSDIGRLILAAESQLHIDTTKPVMRAAKLAPSRLDKIVSNRKFKN